MRITPRKGASCLHGCRAWPVYGQPVCQSVPRYSPLSHGDCSRPCLFGDLRMSVPITENCNTALCAQGSSRLHPRMALHRASDVLSELQSPACPCPHATSVSHFYQPIVPAYASIQTFFQGGTQSLVPRPLTWSQNSQASLRCAVA